MTAAGRLMAHRVIARRCSNLVAFGAKRTFSTPRSQYQIYEYAALVNATRIGADRGGVRRWHYRRSGFGMTIERQAGATGGRVRIGITGKLLPFKYYGAKENPQALGYGMSESRLRDRT